MAATRVTRVDSRTLRVEIHYFTVVERYVERPMDDRRIREDKGRC